MPWIQKLKDKWKIKTNWDFWIIMLVFSIAGAFIGFERKGVFHFLGITDQTPLWIKILIYVPLIFPLYQMNLIVFGTLFGQFKFFWEKEKQLGRFFLKLLIPR